MTEIQEEVPLLEMGIKPVYKNIGGTKRTMSTETLKVVLDIGLINIQKTYETALTASCLNILGSWFQTLTWERYEGIQKVIS